MEKIWEVAEIPLLLCLIFIFYGIRLWSSGDASVILGKSDKAPLKDEKKFTRYAACLMFGFAGGSLLMALISLWNVTAAFAEIVICTVIITILWRRMNKKYGK